MTMASLDVVFPVGGVILGLQPYCTGVLWVKTLNKSWMSDGEAFDVVPSLEASSLKTQHGLWHCWSIVYGGFSQRRQFRRMASWKGVAKPTRRPCCLGGGKGCHLVADW
jgi:hypothetical protein